MGKPFNSNNDQFHSLAAIDMENNKNNNNNSDSTQTSVSVVNLSSHIITPAQQS